MSCHHNELIMERLFEEGLDKGLNDQEALIYANEQFEQLLWIKAVNQDQVIKINSMRILTKSFVKQRKKMLKRINTLAILVTYLAILVIYKDNLAPSEDNLVTNIHVIHNI